ncbi:transglycosylase SLT domain-containing protein [Fluviispira multicolorata]|uniref:Transglycosylase SLT domain-containing protein n=2 Tax=Fluviispira multicolorata TaxID=2654512 RepID=A0A833N644_9BACT|nr:transglycosylase SLT domain-containing protein [Fluviispira multicolorata]
MRMHPCARMTHCPELVAGTEIFSMRLFISWLLRMYHLIQTNINRPQLIWARMRIDMGCKSHLSFLNMRVLFIAAVMCCTMNIQFSHARENLNSEIMGKKYINFYKDFLMIKNLRERDYLEELKQTFLKKKQSSEKIYTLLGMLNLAIEGEEKIYAEFAIYNLKKNRKYLNSDENEIYKTLFGKYLNQQKDFSGSVLVLKSIANRSDSVLFSIISPLYIDALLSSNLKAEALDYYAKYKKVIDKNIDWEKLNELLVKLANAALTFNNPNLSLSYLKKPLLFYPLEKSGRDAMILLSTIECSGGSLGSLYFRDESMQYLSREIFKRIGKQPDSRNYILSLIGVNPASVHPAQEIESLPMTEKERLLGLANMLVTAREYYLANQMLDYLIGAKNYNEIFSRDKILELRGRVLNSLELPVKAAQNYKELFTEFPISKMAEIARIKYSTSLHFAKRHSESANYLLQNIVFPTNEEQNWSLFWQYYLSSQKNEAEKTAKNYIVKEFKKQNSTIARFQYWLSLLDKGKFYNVEYKKELEFIGKKVEEYPYPIFSRWRLNKFKWSDPQNDKMHFNSFKDYYNNKLNPFFKGKLNNKKIEHLRRLVQYDLSSIASLYIDDFKNKKLKKNEAIILANLAYSSYDYKNAGDLARNYFANPIDDYSYKEVWTEKTNFWKLNFPLAYWPDVSSVAKLLDLDPFWILSIMRAESRYLSRAESPVGAIGLMQIMPYTGINIANNIGKDDFKISSLKSPSQSIAFAAWYLKMLLTIYKGNYLLATAAYNSGPEAVNRWINQNNSLTVDEFYENIPYQETKKYVAKVLGYLDMYYRVHLGIGDGYSLECGESIPSPNTRLDIF